MQTPKYDRIGIDYNSTRTADPYLASRLHQLLQAKSNGIYLDIGCGTGNYTDALNKKGIQFIGLDPSPLMLEKAKRKNTNIDWRLGTAERTELPDQSVEGFMATFTLHHWSNLSTAFSELARTCKSGARFVILTALPEQMEGYWLNHYFPKMLHDSIVQMPSFEAIQNAIKGTGLEIANTEKYNIKDDLVDHFLYCGKNRPWLYLDPNIRKGISSFSDLSNQEEVQSGLTQLAKDIDNQKINKIIASYQHEAGDYLFIEGFKD